MSDPQNDRFDEAFRKWAAQPSSTLPDEAARRVLARLPEPTAGGWFGSSRWRFAAAAVGMALLLVVAWVTVPHPSDPMGQEVALPPLEDNVVLLWLDEKTPLYLTVAPPATQGGLQ